jgi:hypothetical protein
MSLVVVVRPQEVWSRVEFASGVKIEIEEAQPVLPVIR